VNKKMCFVVLRLGGYMTSLGAYVDHVCLVPTHVKYVISLE